MADGFSSISSHVGYSTNVICDYTESNGNEKLVEDRDCLEREENGTHVDDDRPVADVGDDEEKEDGEDAFQDDKSNEEADARSEDDCQQSHSLQGKHDGCRDVQRPVVISDVSHLRVVKHLEDLHFLQLPLKILPVCSARNARVLGILPVLDAL